MESVKDVETVGLFIRVPAILREKLGEHVGARIKGRYRMKSQGQYIASALARQLQRDSVFTETEIEDLREMGLLPTPRT